MYTNYSSGRLLSLVLIVGVVSLAGSGIAAPTEVTTEVPSATTQGGTVTFSDTSSEDPPPSDDTGGDDTSGDNGTDDGGSTDGSSSDSVSVHAPSQATAGETVTLEYTIRNTGASADGYIFNGSLPNGWTVVNHTDDSGSWNPSETKWFWATVGSNESVTPSLTLSVPADVSGNTTLSGVLKNSSGQQGTVDLSILVSDTSSEDPPPSDDNGGDDTSGDDTGDDTSGDDTGDDTSGDDTGDDTSGDDTGDDTSGDDTGDDTSGDNGTDDGGSTDGSTPGFSAIVALVALIAAALLTTRRNK